VGYSLSTGKNRLTSVGAVRLFIESQRLCPKDVAKSGAVTTIFCDITLAEKL